MKRTTLPIGDARRPAAPESLDRKMDSLFRDSPPPANQPSISLPACVVACTACLLLGFLAARLLPTAPEEAAALIPADATPKPAAAPLETRVVCVLPPRDSDRKIFSHDTSPKQSGLFSRPLTFVSTNGDFQ